MIIERRNFHNSIKLLTDLNFTWTFEVYVCFSFLREVAKFVVLFSFFCFCF